MDNANVLTCGSSAGDNLITLPSCYYCISLLSMCSRVEVRQGDHLITLPYMGKADNQTSS